MKRLPGVLLGLTALAGAVCPVLMPGVASAGQITAYVSAQAAPGSPDTSCAAARYTTVNGAIHVAGHSTAGVYGNVVAHNLLAFNGTLRKSPGAGVVVATEVPHETVAGNTVIGNTIYGNGIAGVTIHGHQPGLHMAGNMVLDNNIGRNNTVGDTIGLAPPAKNNPDLRTTGILVGSSTHIAVLIAGNHIHHDYYGIYIDGFVRGTFGGNHYRRVHTQVKFT